MAGISIKAVFQNVKKGMASPEFAGKLPKRKLQEGMRITLEKAITIARRVTPQGATGGLKESVASQMDTAISSREVVGRVAWNAVYAQVVDSGGPPRFVPIGPLLAWAEVVLGDAKLAYPVQRSIAVQGTLPQNFIEAARAEIDTVLRRNLGKMAAEMARDLERNV